MHPWSWHCSDQLWAIDWHIEFPGQKLVTDIFFVCGRARTGGRNLKRQVSGYALQIDWKPFRSVQLQARPLQFWLFASDSSCSFFTPEQFFPYINQIVSSCYFHCRWYCASYWFFFFYKPDILGGAPLFISPGLFYNQWTGGLAHILSIPSFASIFHSLQSLGIPLCSLLSLIISFITNSSFNLIVTMGWLLSEAYWQPFVEKFFHSSLSWFFTQVASWLELLCNPFCPFT